MPFEIRDFTVSFRVKVIQLSEIVIQIRGVLLRRKGACDSGLGKNDPVSRMIQLSVSLLSGVYYTTNIDSSVFTFEFKD